MHPHARLLALLAVAAASVAAADVTVELRDPDKGARITNTYEPTNLRVELTVTWRQAGSVLDTIGINAAPVGSFTLSLDSDGRPWLAVYAPTVPGPLRDRSGWHRLRHPRTAAAGTAHALVMQVRDGMMELGLNDEFVAADLPAALSGQPIFVGDFNGDEGWGEAYHIHGGMVGTVVVRYFGVGKDQPAAPTQATSPSAPVTAVAAVLDETGQLTAGDVAQLAAALARLQRGRGVALGLIACSRPPESLGAFAESQRDRWVADGVLPEASAVFLTAGDQFYWQYDDRVKATLTFDDIKAAWLPVARQPLAQALAAFVAALAGEAPPQTSPTAPQPAPTPQTTAPQPQPTSTPEQPGPAAVDGRAAGLEAALRAGDAAAAAPFLWGDLRDGCAALFRQQPEAMRQLADLLAGRSFVAQGLDVAEYVAVADGRRYPLTFIHRGGQWYLAGF